MKTYPHSQKWKVKNIELRAIIKFLIKKGTNTRQIGQQNLNMDEAVFKTRSNLLGYPAYVISQVMTDSVTWWRDSSDG